MPQHFQWNDFKAGWIPSDDSISGRKDGFLQMDNVELDRNGAVSLAGGTVPLAADAATSHTLYTHYINGALQLYKALSNGSILRNSTSIGSGGDASIAAFSAAFDFVLACSGNTRKKDNGTTVYNLGISPPNAAPTASLQQFASARIDWATFGTIVNIVGTSTAGGGILSVLTAVTNGIYIAIFQTKTVPGTPYDFSMAGFGGGTPQDKIPINVAATSPSDISNLSSLRIDFLLTPSNPAGDVVSDYFTWVWVNDGSHSGTGLALNARRSEFQRVGTGSQDWSTVYGVRMTVIGYSGIGFTITGSPSTGFNFLGGLQSSLQGNYQYACLNVFNTGSYLAKSILGPVLTLKAPLDMNYTTVTPQNPGAIDSSVNEVWLFRRGGLLSQWYRVAVFLAAGGWVAQNDLTDDQSAIVLNITVNLNLISIASSSISDKILDIVGPIEGRWYYFTPHFMYPSDINDPDLVDPSLAVRTTGSLIEIFLWARKISDAAVLVGTDVEIYLLTGTFQTLPDNTVDVFYRPTGCHYPPKTYDAAAFEGSVYYLAADGWRLATPALFSMTYGGGANSLLTVPNTDRLYRAINCYGYNAPNIQQADGTFRMPVAIGKNKLWCVITGQNRIEVYDFARKYWRVIKYGLGDATAIHAGQDGNIYAAFSNDLKVRLIDVEGTDLLVDQTTKQTVNLLSPVFDGPLEQPMPRNRKDLYTFKARLLTGGANLLLSIVDDQGISRVIGNLVSNAASPTEQFIDVSNFLPISKTFQFSLAGTFGRFVLADMSLDFDARPAPLTFLRLYNNNFGTASKKRVRVWPQIIDTLGHPITFAPTVDNSPTAQTTIQTTDKTTVPIFFTSDAFGKDYGATLSGGLFEYWGELPPDIVQVLPIARRFDQVGPAELFRYGRIKQFEIRILPYGTSLPFNIYFSDNSIVTGNLTLTVGVEASYFIGLPKTTGGSIVRIELGPTSFDFHRYYIRLQVMKSGADTELEWVTLGTTEGA